MSYFLKNQNKWLPTSEREMDLHKVLPPGNYVVKQHPLTHTFWLETVDDFVLPKRLYGGVMGQATRVLRTFEDRPGSTGVLLAGQKGSGKTLLAKVVSVMAGQAKMPTIIVNAPLVGDDFNQMIQTMEQGAVVLYDEFEKVFNKEQQQAMLTLLDGVFPTKKLFILTCNDAYALDQNLHNRPGRMFYMLEYEGVSAEAIREYCQDRLKDQKQTDSVLRVSLLFESFNFDMLQALVEEMNRYGEAAAEAIQMLNIKPRAERFSTYDVMLVYEGKPVEPVQFCSSDEISGSPLNYPRMVFTINLTEDQEGDHIQLEFFQRDLVSANADKGEFHYKSGDSKLILKRQRHEGFSYQHYLRAGF